METSVLRSEVRKRTLHAHRSTRSASVQVHTTSAPFRRHSGESLHKWKGLMGDCSYT